MSRDRKLIVGIEKYVSWRRKLIFSQIGLTQSLLLRKCRRFTLFSVFNLYLYTDHAWLRERAILAAKSLDVDAINFKLQRSLPGNEITFKSIDTVVDPDEEFNYPAEFLNLLDFPGMPPHNLRLKIGSPIILLQNLNALKIV
ncbi:ATP-dependent DNA helicase [Trichonephila clavipes]|nr:ATP-dependent DNA helicase [Trichonephila clavipes]